MPVSKDHLRVAGYMKGQCQRILQQVFNGGHHSTIGLYLREEQSISPKIAKTKEPFLKHPIQPCIYLALGSHPKLWLTDFHPSIFPGTQKNYKADSFPNAHVKVSETPLTPPAQIAPMRWSQHSNWYSPVFNQTPPSCSAGVLWSPTRHTGSCKVSIASIVDSGKNPAI